MKLIFTLLLLYLTVSLWGQQLQTGHYCQEKCAGITIYGITFENDSTFEIRFYDPKAKINQIKLGMGHYLVNGKTLRLNFSVPNPNKEIHIERINNPISDSIEVKFDLTDNIIGKELNDYINITDKNERILGIGDVNQWIKIPKSAKCKDITISFMEHKELNLQLCESDKYIIKAQPELKDRFDLFDSSENMIFEIKSIKPNKIVLYNKILRRKITYVK